MDTSRFDVVIINNKPLDLTTIPVYNLIANDTIHRARTTLDHLEDIIVMLGEQVSDHDDPAETLLVAKQKWPGLEPIGDAVVDLVMHYEVNVSLYILAAVVMVIRGRIAELDRMRGDNERPTSPWLRVASFEGVSMVNDPLYHIVERCLDDGYSHDIVVHQLEWMAIIPSRPTARELRSAPWLKFPETPRLGLIRVMAMVLAMQDASAAIRTVRICIDLCELDRTRVHGKDMDNGGNRAAEDVIDRASTPQLTMAEMVERMAKMEAELAELRAKAGVKA